MRKAVLRTIFWVVVSLGVNLLVYLWKGSEAALQFFTGYLLEKSLSVDNLFVFYLIFSTFKIPKSQQFRLLVTGLAGAIVLRLLLITAGVLLIAKFQWIFYILGAFLLITAGRLLVGKNKIPNFEENLLVKFVKKSAPKLATPFFMALIAIEVADIIFALDSIPAIFAITLDPFIVFTSNICAVLGLRSLYFVLAGAIDRFRALKTSISIILCLIGLKMLLSGVYEFPLLLTLGMIALILASGVAYSLFKNSPQR